MRPKPDNTNPTITRAALKRAARPIIQKDVLTVISIVQSPNPILNQVCDPCDLGDKSLKKLAKQMARPCTRTTVAALLRRSSAWRSGSW